MDVDGEPGTTRATIGVVNTELEDLPHVFERLYVAQQHPRDRESGSGLGLAIVNELVEAMGGTVSAEAAAPTGTTLVVRLSRSDD